MGRLEGIRTASTVVAVLILGVGSPSVGTEGPTVCVKTIHVDALSGTLESFDLENGLVLNGQGQPPTKIPPSDVVRIATLVHRTPPDPAALCWVLTNGDILHASFLSGTERTVTLRREDLGPIELPVTRLSEIVAGGHRASHPDDEVRSVTSRPVADDEIVLANGDQLTGLIERIDSNGLTIDIGRARATIRLDVVRWVRLARSSPATTQAEGAHPLRALLTLRDGSTLTASLLQWRGGELGVQPEWGPQTTPKRLRADRVVRMEILGGRWQWLDARPPRVAEHTPLLDVRWPHRVGRNVLGRPLRVGARLYDRGIGVHSASRLIYSLNETDERFVTSYGMDDDSGPLAHVEVKVLLDGKPVHHAPDVRADGQIRHLSVEIRGARQLELRVDFGKNGDVQDRFDWIEPAILRR